MKLVMTADWFDLDNDEIVKRLSAIATTWNLSEERRAQLIAMALLVSEDIEEYYEQAQTIIDYDGSQVRIEITPLKRRRKASDSIPF